MESFPWPSLATVLVALAGAWFAIARQLAALNARVQADREAAQARGAVFQGTLDRTECLVRAQSGAIDALRTDVAKQTATLDAIGGRVDRLEDWQDRERKTGNGMA